jgi:hypothetical protein
MFGHGQIEGFEEKYGMEYRRSYRDEQPDLYLVDRHEREIFPLVKRRALFSGSAAFRLYDLFTAGGGVNENVFAYSNRHWDDRALIFYNNSYHESSGWIHRSSPAIPQGDGSYRQDTLSEALSIHGESQYFTLLWEQRSGLWFIRSSKEISEKGLFVSLKGYEAQAFLDIHEVEDGPEGRWAMLNHELNGRGTPDPEAAVQDICLGELYYRFTELLRPELVEAVRGFFTGTGTAGAKDLVSSLKEPVFAFAETALKFVGGADGAYDPFVRKGREPALAPERIAEDFGAYMARLLDLAAYSGGKNAARAKAAGDPAGPWLTGLAAALRDRPPVIAAALGYGVLSLLRPILGSGASGAEAARLGFDHWHLDRKLREQYRRAGISEDEAGRLTALMQAALSRTVPESRAPYETGAASKPGLLGTAIIEENYQDEDFRKALGINFFDDVTWFNKEGFEEALFYGSLFFLLENNGAFEEYSGGKKKSAKPGTVKKLKAVESAGPDRAGKAPIPRPDRAVMIAVLSDVLARAEKASGYRLDGLLDRLAGENGGKAAPGLRGKTAGPKKPV